MLVTGARGGKSLTYSWIHEWFSYSPLSLKELYYPTKVSGKL